MITRLQPTISHTGIRYILDNQGREIASISSLHDGVDNSARAKEEEYIHNAICDSFNHNHTQAATIDRLTAALESLVTACTEHPAVYDGTAELKAAIALLAEVKGNHA